MPTQLFRDYLSNLESSQGFLMGLLTIDASGNLLRFNSGTYNVLSRGETYFSSGFDFRIPDKISDGEQRTAIILPMADLQIWTALQQHPNKLVLNLEIVLSTTPDDVEIGPLRLEDTGREYDSTTQRLQITCGYRDVLRNPRPGSLYTPATVPGMFSIPNLTGVL